MTNDDWKASIIRTGSDFIGASPMHLNILSSKSNAFELIIGSVGEIQRSLNHWMSNFWANHTNPSSLAPNPKTPKVPVGKNNGKAINSKSIKIAPWIKPKTLNALNILNQKENTSRLNVVHLMTSAFVVGFFLWLVSAGYCASIVSGLWGSLWQIEGWVCLQIWIYIHHQ